MAARASRARRRPCAERAALHCGVSEQSAAAGDREQPSREARGARREATADSTSSMLCGGRRTGIHHRVPGASTFYSSDPNLRSARFVFQASGCVLYSAMPAVALQNRHASLCSHALVWRQNLEACMVKLTGTSREEYIGSIVPALKLGGSPVLSSRPFWLARVPQHEMNFCVDTCSGMSSGTP
ncbi:uncharacterized protein [Miscanthus floridulus]|uniref:uncharacterized protein isoform X1 n=1 Tax=Miscanthus floridulus TaxID=154761 RepID=UPI003458C7BA